MEDFDSGRVKLSKLELVPGVGPFITTARALLDKDNNLRVRLTPKQDKLYTAYLGLHLVGLLCAKAYVLTDGFTRPAPQIYAFY